MITNNFIINTKVKQNIILATLLITLLLLIILTPNTALATAVDTEQTVVAAVFISISQMLKTLLSFVFLPIAIAIVIGKIVYLALVCGMIGKDPLNLTGTDTTPSPAAVSKAIKEELKNTLYGLLWVGGIWLLFRILLDIGIVLVGAISQNMGG